MFMQLSMLRTLNEISGCFSNLNWTLVVGWLIIVFIDIFTGVLKSIKSKKFSSHTMKEHLIKKVTEIFLILALGVADVIAGMYGINIPAFEAMIIPFCFKDLASILENAIEIGVKVPDFVHNWFKSKVPNIKETIEKIEDDE